MPGRATSAGLVMVTAPQAAIPPARKPRAADGFFVGVTLMARALLTKGTPGPVGWNAGDEDEEAILS